MSKISVFRFNISGAEQKEVANTILGYLKSRYFFYDTDYGCFRTGKPSNTQKATDTIGSLGASVVTTLFSGMSTVLVSYHVVYGFEYTIDNSQLVIKAYILGKKGKSYIHSTFNQSKEASRYYNDLKQVLFKALEKQGVVLEKKMVDSIHDGFELKLFLSVLGVFIIGAILLVLFLVIILGSTGTS